MIFVYSKKKKTYEPHALDAIDHTEFKEALWIDLLRLTKDEEKQVEKLLGFEIPTREEMREIELSSRLYRVNGILFMTATMIAQSESTEPKHDAVTFILTKQQLITIRYIEPHAFRMFTLHIPKIDPTSSIELFIELLDATIDRLADILELVGHQLDEFSKTIFRQQNSTNESKIDYQQLLQQIGVHGDLNTKARESLVTFNRLITFFAQSSGSQVDTEGQLRLTTLTKDIGALSDHSNFLSSKINFLLDATLGMVSIEQNNIIKIFSVAAVIFLPPTLIASIYGMNFHFMPELSWKGGYLFAIGLMLLASWLPYKYFKSRKWL